MVNVGWGEQDKEKRRFRQESHRLCSCTSSSTNTQMQIRAETERQAFPSSNSTSLPKNSRLRSSVEWRTNQGAVDGSPRKVKSVQVP
jgi:hypothetical protein